VLPDKVELISIGPITPTVNEVALVLAVLAVLPAHRADTRRSVFGPVLMLVLVAVAVGTAIGLQRHGDFAQIVDADRALLMIVGYVVIRRAFARHLPQLLALLVVGAAVASTVEVLAAVFDWQRLLVDEVTQVETLGDTSDVSRLAAPILVMWGPLLIMLLSGALPRRPRWLWAVLVLPGVVHVIMSFNRSTWGPLLLCVVLIAGACFGIRGMVKRGLIIGLLGALLLGGLSVGVFGSTGEALVVRFTSLATGSALDSDSLEDRLGEDVAAMQTLRVEPVLGTGMGQPYGGTIISYDNLHGNTVVDPRPWIHNQYLRIWLLMGALGLFAFGAVLVRVIVVVTRCWFRCVPAAALAVATGLGLACIAAQSVLQTTLVDRSSVLTVGVLLAVLALTAGWKPASTEETRSVESESDDQQTDTRTIEARTAPQARERMMVG
jgi:O-antigen ligase